MIDSQSIHEKTQRTVSAAMHKLGRDSFRRSDFLITPLEVKVPGLDPVFDGYRIVHFTDIHLGHWVSIERLEGIVSLINEQQPDLVVNTGDFVSYVFKELELPMISAFRRISASDGALAVLGNHDHYTGAPDQVCRQLEDAGIGMLQNRHVLVEKGGDRLALAGIDDLAFGRPDLDQALAGVPVGSPVILVSHNPDIFFEAARKKVDLVLSGHTHGGQIRCPGLPVLVRMSRFSLDEGRYTAAGSELVVSRGLGAIGLPFRFACPPEAVLLILRPGPA